jgi:hypothetical protein
LSAAGDRGRGARGRPLDRLLTPLDRIRRDLAERDIPIAMSTLVAAKLRPFRGTLTADAEHRFNDVFVSGHVLEADCNAHGRRKFHDGADTQPVLAAEGGVFLGAVNDRPRGSTALRGAARLRVPRHPNRGALLRPTLRYVRPARFGLLPASLHLHRRVPVARRFVPRLVVRLNSPSRVSSAHPAFVLLTSAGASS